MLNSADYYRFSDLYSVCLKTIDHLSFKLRIFSGHNASFKVGVLKVQDFEKLSPMLMSLTHGAMGSSVIVSFLGHTHLFVKMLCWSNSLIVNELYARLMRKPFAYLS